MCRLSIVVPTFNEALTLQETLQRLQSLRVVGHEVLLVDGGSSDGTQTLAKPLVDRVMQAPRGRARQMNVGASVATGDVLLFLHADTTLPEATPRLLCAALRRPGVAWGRFDVRLSGQQFRYRIIEFFMNLRSRLTGIATGDQALFVKRDVFQQLGGFPDLPLMEDLALSRRLKRQARPICLQARVTTSSRRWERDGWLRTVLLMWGLRLAFALGVSPARLARVYYGSRPS